MSDVVRSFLSPEEIRSALGLERTDEVEETLEAPNIPTEVSLTRPSRNAIEQDETSNAEENSKTSEEGKASTPFPYIPGMPNGSPSSSTSSNSNPLYGGYSPPGKSDATLIIGGFNVLLVPMPGVSANNMGSMLQNGQQLSQLAPGNPFAGSKAAV